MWHELGYLAYHLHWDPDVLLDLEHRDRCRFIGEVAELNDRAWQEVTGGRA
jgi:hypothetical protein